MEEPKEVKDQASEGAQGAASISEIREVGEQVAKQQAGGNDLIPEGKASDSPEPVVRPATIEEAREEKLRQHLEYLKEHRDRAKEPEMIDGEPNPRFIQFRDCDQILLKGTVIDIGGVPCRLLVDAPIASVSFRDEGVFAECLAHSGGANLAVNAPALRKRYKADGSVAGVNEAHGAIKLDEEIAQVEKAIEENREAAAQAAVEPKKAE